MSSTEQRSSFVMHPCLLADVIFRQAGTLTKAIVELVMNSIDAGATQIDITLTAEVCTVDDNGRGIQTEADIEKCFATFGSPHTADEQKTYGTFRMGRGQAFAFGKNTWATGKFLLHVNAKQDGLTYALEHLDEPVDGCQVRIALYAYLSDWGLQDTIRGLQKFVRFSPVPVLVNGERISEDVDATEWTSENDLACTAIRAGTEGVDVYNLGIYVCTLSSGLFGAAGVVVSKQQLRVNFARNEVQDDCGVWQQILPAVHAQAAALVSTRTRLNDGQRTSVIRQLLAKRLTKWQKLALFTLVTGEHVNIEKLTKLLSRCATLTYTDAGSMDGDTIHRMGLAVVLSTKTAQDFGYGSPSRLVECLLELPGLPYAAGVALRATRAVEFRDIRQRSQQEFRLLDELNANEVETIWLKSLRKAMTVMAVKYGGQYEGYRRKIMLGECLYSRAWTDGVTYVAFSRDQLADNKFGTQTVVYLASLLLHELVHEQSDAGGHCHDQGFYEAFHDRASGREYARLVTALFAAVHSTLQAAGKRTSKSLNMVAALSDAQLQPECEAV